MLRRPCRALAVVSLLVACLAPATTRDTRAAAPHLGSRARCATLEVATAGLPTPVAPADEAWYDRRDNPATPGVNEAARDIARAIDSSGGELARHTYSWLVRGGRMVILVGGTNFENSVGGWNAPAQDWVRELSKERTGCAVVPVLQIDYKLPGLLGGIGSPLNMLAYLLSYDLGLRRAKRMIRKAVSAGSRDVWILGHSKGADIVGNAVADLAYLPQLTTGFSFAVPNVDFQLLGVRSLVAPSPDPAYRRSGLFKYDVHNGRRFFGKLIVFSKYSDRVANNVDPFRFWDLVDYGHDYVRVLGDPGFRARLRALVAAPEREYEDRAAGPAFDF
ncbi:MAG: hypothetical protein HYZ53_08780 [Planctomycetes bacterium]|nr:hypothetical protein [Planctomycetota bacterium]